MLGLIHEESAPVGRVHVGLVFLIEGDVPEIVLEPTHDFLVDLGRDKGPAQVLVGFAAETDDLVENAAGPDNSPRWSPDGSQLAFVSTRGDHSFIAVYDMPANQLRFLSPSVDRDLAPRWSPDSRRIAFIRLFNVTDTFSNDRDRLQLVLRVPAALAVELEPKHPAPRPGPDARPRSWSARRP